MKEKEQLIKEIVKAGFSEAEAKNVTKHLTILAMHMTVMDAGLRALPVEAMRMLCRSAKQHETVLDDDRGDRMEMLADVAEKYQARFGEAATPQINAFPSKPITA